MLLIKKNRRIEGWETISRKEKKNKGAEKKGFEVALIF